MKAIFIGKNGSMSLKNGETYNLKAINRYDKYPIWLEISSNKHHKVYCPYSSFESLFRNWEFSNNKNITTNEIDNSPYTNKCGGAGACRYDDYGRCDAPNGICNPN